MNGPYFRDHLSSIRSIRSNIIQKRFEAHTHVRAQLVSIEKKRDNHTRALCDSSF